MNKKLILFVFLLFIIGSVSFISAEIQYPVAKLGNCASEQDCKIYCDDINNIEPCLDFAEENNMMTATEIEEAKKFLPFLKAGTTPGGCKSEGECDAYCDKEENTNECVDFAVKAGMVSAEEAEMIKKTGGKGPGGCKGEEECDAYCENEANLNECIDFAVQYGMVSAEEAEMIKKTGGKGPGGCKGEEECDAFCQAKENFETCVDFAVQNGMISSEDAEMAKKTGGESPGNCKSQEECDAFCSSEEGRMACLEFSYEHGMISEEEYKQRKEGAQMGQQTGPGGCKSEEECKAYCEANPSECGGGEPHEGDGFELGEEGAGTGEPGSYEPGTMPGGEPGDMPTETPGTAPGGEAGGYYVPPEEAPTGDGGSGGTTPGGGSGGAEPGDAPGGDSAGSYEAPSDSGGESAPTGGVIRETSRNGLFEKAADFFRNLF